MANHKSAIKKMRQDEERRLRNKMYKTRMKTAVKNVEAALNAQDKEAAKQAFRDAVPVIDRVASKGVIHKNKAARKKSRLAKRVNALGTAPSPEA
ncbi:30S ribosomal protein S20 [candidate division KSB3 bacterium]|uniref:Small ribosomal subunit protein bS20 n=1 Tax=candidate division KSB3 bacterium TaxID=2044937 RepID=A0A9D5JUW7_9BACT|nr:30S ribosomal protein S20 [candidate division KSB3 bacterium]MBD3324699.1 30S ribosomal protein S20 [candidate division KSB3 bacterium]